MEAQLHGRHHHYEEDPHHDIAGLHSGDSQHGEKKLVLKKVKDKAKKIKDTIKKRGHGHEHEYRHDQIPEEEEEEDDEDEDMVNAPQVHVYESPVIPGTNLPIQTGVPKMRNEVYPNYVGDEGIVRPPGLAGKMGTEFERSSVEARRPEFENLLPQSSSSDATFMEEANVAEPTVQISPLIGLEEDPHSPKIHPGKIPPSNYQSKVTDPRGEGGTEAEVAPLLQRLDNVHIHDQTESNPVPEQRFFAGSHDQFAPQSIPTVDQFIPESNPVNPCEKPHESMPRDTIAGKISPEVSAKDMVVSKLGYGGQPQDGVVSSKKPVTELATEYGHKVAEKLAPVYDKVAGAGSAVISKAQGGVDTVAKGTDRGVSVKEYLVKKLRPGEEDKALSEAIRERFYKKKEGKEEEVEPEEVAACFGTAKEVTGSESSGGGVVERLKGAVGSWLGKSSETRSAHHSLGQSHGSVPTVGIGPGK